MQNSTDKDDNEVVEPDAKVYDYEVQDADADMDIDW
jgi:hypothetical protein